jgi:hypothetical protein
MRFIPTFVLLIIIALISCDNSENEINIDLATLTEKKWVLHVDTSYTFANRRAIFKDTIIYLMQMVRIL